MIKHNFFGPLIQYAEYLWGLRMVIAHLTIIRVCLKGGHIFPADGDVALKTWRADPIFLFIICRRLLERAHTAAGMTSAQTLLIIFLNKV
jgi:hypothetical protein